MVTYHHFLGLRNLTNISKTINLIRLQHKNFDVPYDLNNIGVFQMIQKGDVDGVFQLESAGMRKLLMDMRVANFNDIAMAIALYRPGPMEMIPTFLRRKNKEEVPTYPIKELETILNETYGTIVYQEQIMLIAKKIAGYSYGQADILRRAITKKKKDVMISERENFIDGCIKNGYSRDSSSELFDYIEKFANYGFNKAHSVAYAMISYLTGYLKLNYQEYYMAILMNSVIGSDKDTYLYYKTLKNKSINVLFPHINESSDEYIVYNKYIIMPLSLIKGIGQIKITEILDERTQNGKYVSFESFLNRTNNILSPQLIENIIYSGALDCFNLTIKAMISSYSQILSRQKYSFLENVISTQFESDEFSYIDLLEHEKNVYGFNLKYNFFVQYQNLYVREKILHIGELKKNISCKILGKIDYIRVIETKNKEKMSFMDVSDEFNQISCTLFPTVFSKYGDLITGQLVKLIGKTESRNDKLSFIVDEVEIF